ncbi:unnamed protein product, partial [Iphiclides podalirius]
MYRLLLYVSDYSIYFRRNTRSSFAMIWILIFIIQVVLILKYNEALNRNTLSTFTKNLESLVQEMSIYFQPCSYPIELIAGMCMDKTLRK